MIKYVVVCLFIMIVFIQNINALYWYYTKILYSKDLLKIEKFPWYDFKSFFLNTGVVQYCTAPVFIKKQITEAYDLSHVPLFFPFYYKCIP